MVFQTLQRSVFTWHIISAEAWPRGSEGIDMCKGSERTGKVLTMHESGARMPVTQALCVKEPKGNHKTLLSAGIDCLSFPMVQGPVHKQSQPNKNKLTDKFSQ